jgi:hypothetical protein
MYCWCPLWVPGRIETSIVLHRVYVSFRGGTRGSQEWNISINWKLRWTGLKLRIRIFQSCIDIYSGGIGGISGGGDGGLGLGFIGESKYYCQIFKYSQSCIK